MYWARHYWAARYWGNYWGETGSGPTPPPTGKKFIVIGKMLLRVEIKEIP